jgi:hypothetical protein
VFAAAYGTPRRLLSKTGSGIGLGRDVNAMTEKRGRGCGWRSLVIPSPARRSLWGNIARAAKLENHSPLWRVLPWGKRRTSGEIILFLKSMAGACAEIRFERLAAMVGTIAAESAATFNLFEGCGLLEGAFSKPWIGFLRVFPPAQPASNSQLSLPRRLPPARDFSLGDAVGRKS